MDGLKLSTEGAVRLCSCQRVWGCAFCCLFREEQQRPHAWMAPFFSRSVFHDVPVYPCFLEREVWGLRPSCWVAESRRHGDRSRRSWHPKNQRILSVIVMLVTGTGDKVVYRLGRSKGRARSPTACGGPTRGRRGDRSPPLGAHFDFFGRR